MCGLTIPKYPNVIVGLDKPDDAGVVRLDDDTAIVQHLDYITPVVDDPYDFGMIAAANSLSDIWAMGAKPITAMNVVCFPEKKLDMSVLTEILKGGLDKCTEANVALIGGHSVRNEDVKFGLSVTGLVHPKKVITKGGINIGDKLILTKPVGIGLISTAYKLGMVGQKAVDTITEVMIHLNRDAVEAALEVGGISAMTDITGFALIGHSSEMAEQSEASIEIYSDQVPLIACDDGALANGLKALVRELKDEMGILPEGYYNNEEFRSHMVDGSQVDEDMMTILYDPQTSGGLLIAVSPDKVDEMLERIRGRSDGQAAIVGQVVKGPRVQIIVR